MQSCLCGNSDSVVPLDLDIIAQNVSAAIREDLGPGDITAQLISDTCVAKAVVRVRESAIIAGQAWVDATFTQIDSSIQRYWLVAEGERVSPDQSVLVLSGPARSILTAERTAMNFLQTLSGTATLVADYVEAICDFPVVLLDTRKTLPGLRYAQKYAVWCGGGSNHRMGLYDAFLIKENHIASCGSITQAVSQARSMNVHDAMIEVEVENLSELQEALDIQVERIMLDNFSIDGIREAVTINHAAPMPATLEVSGNIDLSNIRAYAATGIDYISVGALTKNIRAIDLSMRVISII